MKHALPYQHFTSSYWLVLVSCLVFIHQQVTNFVLPALAYLFIPLKRQRRQQDQIVRWDVAGFHMRVVRSVAVGKDAVALMALAAAWAGVIRSFFQFEIVEISCCNSTLSSSISPSVSSLNCTWSCHRREKLDFMPSAAYSRLIISRPSVWKVEIIQPRASLRPASGRRALSSHAPLVVKGDRRDMARLVSTTPN